MQIICVRHGGTDASDDNLVQGHTDFDLNERGQRHAEQLRKRFTDDTINIDAVYASDLTRARETAELAFPSHTIHTDERFREQDYGVVVGELSTFLDDHPEYRLTCPERFAQPFPDGESVDDVYHRVVEGLYDVLATHDSDATVVVVCHYTPMVCLASFALDEELHKTWTSEDFRTGDAIVFTETDGEVVLSDRFPVVET